MKKLGDYAELKFTLKAFEKGYAILTPYCDKPYDFVLEKNNTFTRVQVKSCNKPIDAKARFSVGIGYGSSSKRRYTEEHCDVVAVYIRCLDVFYLIPISLIAVVKLTLYPLRKDSKFIEFLENWTI